MEPLGMFSSAGTTADLCKKLLLLCKNVKNAAVETDELRQLLANFQIILTSVEEMRSNPNNAKLKHTHRLGDAIHETQSLLQSLVDDLSPSSETAHRILRKIKGSSIRWPFEKNDILKRINSLERCMQVINKSLQVDQTNLLLDIDYRAILDKLPVASDAYFDSFDESSKARCLPDTRVDLLQDVSNWAKNPDSHAVFWLNGMAGTGKSTISRTISEVFANENRLGASFFFKRGEADRGGLAKFFTTIAADLVRRQPIFAPGIKEAIEAEPGIATKPASDQFKQLILKPLSTIPRDTGMTKPIIIVVDAVDECDRVKDIELLIRMFSRSSQPAFPKLKFFLTSRPELPLRLGFKKIEGSYKDLVLHEVPAAVVESDILKYLEYELLNIRNDYNLTRPDDLKLPESWPGNHTIKILVKMAVPLFIFASTTCRFIADWKHGDPQRQLQRVLQYETKATRSRLDASYLPILDQQLDGLSNSEKAEVAEEFQTIVGTIIILANPLSITALSPILDMSKDVISNRLEMLHSVLDVPSSLDMPVRLLHLSFRDFLLDPDKRDTTSLWVEERQAHTKMADHCLRLLDNLKPDICNLKSPSTSTVDIPRETIGHHLPPEVQYSCLYWVSHVRQSETRLADGGPVSEFLLRHFLHWLEALSLMERTREIISFIQMLQTLVEPESGIKTSAFLRDAEQFVRTHASTIESSPLQLYSSALVFTPSDSIVRIQFQDCIPSWILSPPLIDRSLNPCRHFIEGRSNYIKCIAFSYDSKLLASGSRDQTVKIWDLVTGECLHAMTGHEDFISSVEFSRDSSRLVSASSDHTIRIWHTETGVCIRRLTGHSGTVTSAVFSPDSTLIVSGSHDRTFRIWNEETGECKHTLLDHEVSIATAAFSQDTTLVASASRGGVIRIWSTDSGVCQSMMHQKEPQIVWFMMFSPDSTRLVVVYRDGVLKYWRVDKETCERTINLGIKGLNIKQAALSHDCKYFLYTTTLGKTLLWRIDTEQCVYTFNASMGFTSSVAFSPDSTCFALASVSGDIGIWDVMGRDQNQLMVDPTALDMRPDKIEFSHDSSLVATASPLSNIIMIWRARTGCCIQKLRFPGDNLEDMVFSHDSSLMASVSWENTSFKRHVCIWEIDTGFCTDVEFDVNSLMGRPCFAFSHDLQFFAISLREAFYLRDLSNKGWDHINEKGHWFCCSIFSHDSAVLGAGTTRGTVLLWETGNGQLIYQYSIPGSEIECIAFSHDLGLIAAATKACRIHIIRRDNSECIRTIEAKPGNIDTLAFTYDASFIGASIGGKEGICIWQIGAGLLIHNMHHWSMGRYLQFDGSTQHIPTLMGAGSRKSKLHGVYDHCCGYSVHKNGRWIAWGRRKLLMLPKSYETRKSAVSDCAIVLGYELDKIIILTTSKDGPDLEHMSTMHGGAT
ncbi:hypothetical protein H0G86_000264 [Trichoderma simmonsii]|uniref:NACHT domain-containing protein n=1 Tax=Trichoderma simmonsii TaxID=1491479 RepID=A0A8G0KZ85_9HYPO|nr:hypothetical protein H0G86_000264 [Trichoderma simmonsii]